MSCGPKRGASLKKVTVTIHADNTSSPVLERQGRTDCNAWPGPEASAAIVTEIIERIIPMICSACLSLREMRQRKFAIATYFGKRHLNIARNQFLFGAFAVAQ